MLFEIAHLLFGVTLFTFYVAFYYGDHLLQWEHWLKGGRFVEIFHFESILER